MLRADTPTAEATNRGQKDNMRRFMDVAQDVMVTERGRSVTTRGEASEPRGCKTSLPTSGSIVAVLCSHSKHRWIN